MNKTTGKLFVVATPIGNLGDMVPRAVEVLQSVDLIAAEDTRRSGQLCSHFDIRTTLVAYHDHNEEAQAKKLIEKLEAGKCIALVSDAGMPLISDPGYRLLSNIRERGFEVTVIPGPCAAIVALAGSGLPSDKFQFLGFPPSKQTARKKWFSDFSNNTETLVFYESSHRILASLKDVAEVFGATRKITLARELTKTYETWLTGDVAEVLSLVQDDPNQQKGEFVVVLEGSAEFMSAADASIAKYMEVLIKELPIKKAAAITAELLGLKKSECYEVGLKVQKKH